MKKTAAMNLSSTTVRNGLLGTALVLALATAGTGVYAKYAVSESYADTGTVAKFGVTLTKTDNATFFSDQIMPGDSGDLNNSFTISGQPEVAVDVDYTADLQLTGWEADGAAYCPLAFTVGDDTYQIGDEGIATTAELEQAVEGAIEASGDTYDAGTDLSTAASPTVSWSWSGTSETDAKDTAIGDATTSPTVGLTINATVEQSTAGGGEA